jgi:hypothetical protein
MQIFSEHNKAFANELFGGADIFLYICSWKKYKY